MNFENLQISTQNLPKSQHVLLSPIMESYKKVVLFNSLIYIFVGLVFSTVAYFWLVNPFRFVIGFPLIFAAISVFLSVKNFRNKKYGFREYDVIYQNGWWNTSLEIIPYSRIQHIVISQNWLQKK